MKRVIWALVLVLAGTLAWRVYTPTSLSAQTTTTAPAATQPAKALVGRALIVSVDGMRPDLMLRGQTPNMHRLMERGAFTFWAHTTDVAVTLPSHTSMLTGVTPAKHKVTWNGSQPADKQEYSAVPTIFEVAKAHGLTTGMAAGKQKFVALAKAGTVDWIFISKDTSSNAEVAAEAQKIIAAHRPQLMFVHFPGPDSAGHAFGWSSPEQMKDLASADTGLGVVLKAYEKAGIIDETFIILTADHGGQGRGHGANDPRSRFIPWITAGPGVRVGYDLTIDAALVVGTEDTFATTCYMLGLPLDANLDGKPVLQILSRRDPVTDRP